MKATKQARRDARQLFRLCLANGLLDEDRAREVVRRISQSRYRRRLAVLSRFRRLVELYSARHSASVESAAPLPADLQSTVQAGLARMYGPGLSTSFVQRPVLIAGMRIRVGSDVYDGTVQARLASLEASL